jgi:hypothetical protein
MPLVKRSNGWFWGSKGPFDSKAKALAVARAAYASGYKGESAEKNFLVEEGTQTKPFSSGQPEKK